MVDYSHHHHYHDTVFLQRPFRDFAVYSGGARIVHSKTSPTVSAKPWGVTTTPEQAISPGLYLGSCWPMAGSTGQLTIRLARPINVTQVTVEHLSWVAAYNIYSAPKKIEVWGSIDNVEQLQKAEQYVLSQKFSDSPILGDPLVSGIIGKKKRFLKLSSFTYHPHPFVSSNIQTYPVSKGLRGRGIQSSEVIFRILSNWGFPDYTCIYRVRVHD
jgi:SUN domain-containing protein 1/2